MKWIVICVALTFVTLILSAQTPAWLWAVRAGGAADESGADIAVDAQGNQYVTGSFVNIATFGPYTLDSNGNRDIFAAKLDPDGNWLWAIKAGGAGDDWGCGVDVDGEGNPWLYGCFSGNVSFGPHILSSIGPIDVFLGRLTPEGNWLWAVRAGGISRTGGTDVDVDSAGNACLTGTFEGNIDLGPYTLSSSGGKDIFAAKLDPNGNWLWAVQAGGVNDDIGYGIALDAAGNSCLTGVFYGSVAFGSNTLDSGGISDLFAAKLDPNGNWIWAVGAGGSGYGVSYCIALDSAGNSFLTGLFTGTTTFGPYALSSSVGLDIFAAKLDPGGNWLWAVSAGGIGNAIGYGIGVDLAGNACLVGGFMNTISFGPYTVNAAVISPEICAAGLDPDGNWLWAVGAGGSGEDIAYNVGVDNSGNACLTGIFEGEVAFGPFTINSGGDQDAFIAKLGSGTPVVDELSPPAETPGLSAFPNPFTASTSLTLVGAAPESLYGKTAVSIYDLRGRKVRSLVPAAASPEGLSLAWDGRDDGGACCPTGIYLVRLEQGGSSATLKLTLIK